MTALPWSRPLTRADLDAMPDDGHRYELVDGTLIVTPVPTTLHQRVSGNLLRILDSKRPDKTCEALAGPLNVALADDLVLQPDLLVARVSDFTERDLPTAPLLAVEVTVSNTRLLDTTLKRSIYEDAGCPSYWVVDPEVPSLTAWDLRDGGYVQVAEVRGDEPYHATLPYPVTVVPADLLEP